MNKIAAIFTVSFILFSCGNKTESQDGSSANSSGKTETPAKPEDKTSCAITDEPAKTAMDFLRFYRDNYKLKFSAYQSDMVNEPTGKTGYTVNFTATNKFVEEIQKAGNIRIEVVEDYRRYFMNRKMALANVLNLRITE